MTTFSRLSASEFALSDLLLSVSRALGVSRRHLRIELSARPGALLNISAVGLPRDVADLYQCRSSRSSHPRPASTSITERNVDPRSDKQTVRTSMITGSDVATRSITRYARERRALLTLSWVRILPECGGQDLKIFLCQSDTVPIKTHMAGSKDCAVVSLGNLSRQRRFVNRIDGVVGDIKFCEVRRLHKERINQSGRN